MYESLANSGYDEIICVVMTGMGADGTEGIKNLIPEKPTKVIIQNEDSCIVFGMPGSIVKNKLKHKSVDLKYIANEITLNVGV
jgi:two-component system chemotaxis response regulator CheB